MDLRSQNSLGQVHAPRLLTIEIQRPIRLVYQLAANVHVSSFECSVYAVPD